MSYWTSPGGEAPLKGANFRFPHASGIVLNLVGCENAPVVQASIHAITVAGITGDVTIWSTPGGWGGKLDQPDAWTRIYRQSHPRGWPNHAAPSKIPSVTFDLDEPLKIKPGETVGLYMHTTGWGGMVARAALRHRVFSLETPRGSALKSIVPGCTYSADHVIVRRGCAKTWSPAPFGEVRQWALQRELNGLVIYQPDWLEWSPENDARFPLWFRCSAEIMLQSAALPEAVLAYILGFCQPDWFDQVNLKLPVQAT